MGTVLVLAPHTDDAEIGCGGTMARLVEEGDEVHVAAFSTAEDSLPDGAPPTLLRDEFNVAMDVLGVPHERRHVYEYRVRHLKSHRQEVLETLVELKREIGPDTVFLPSGDDVHQDHQVVHMEGLRAFRDASIMGYELPRNHITFSTLAFVRLEDRHLEMKWKMLQCYESQFELARDYFSREFVESLARVRGVQVGADWAEAFQVYRHII
jgi:LmbE family N-acetylglucosaminyl deacetylase